MARVPRQTSRAATADTVHGIRTTVKQLRSLLRLLRPVIPAAVFAREDARLKTAAGRLSKGRDQAVALKCLTTLADSADDDERQPLLRLKTKLPASKSLSLTDAITRSLGDLDASGRALVLMRIKPGGWMALDLAKSYRRARRRMRTALKEFQPEDLHEWRIAVKRLYYQLQWLHPLWPRRLPALIPLLHDLEHALGADHDLAVLAEMLLPHLDGSSASLLHKALKRRSKHLRHRCRSLGNEIFHERSRHFSKKLQNHASSYPDIMMEDSCAP